MSLLPSSPMDSPASVGTDGQSSGVETFRILSLDGGGIKGTYIAAFLAGIEEMTGKRVADYFDLIVGTSTGGIISVALGLGMFPAEVLDFYVERGPSIFPTTRVANGLRGFTRHLWGGKHAPDELRKALNEVLGTSVLGESRHRLVIPAYDGSSGDIHLFKTAHAPALKRDYSVSAVDVCLATSAAPTYLPAFTASRGTTLVDGGVWASCPAAVGVVEALTILEKPFGSLDLLSIGTTDAPFHIPEKKAVGGLWQWRKFGVELLIQAQAKGALAQAKLLTGDRMVRVSEPVAPGRFSLDDPRETQALVALGTKAARHWETTISSRFLAERAAPFFPYHGPRSEQSPIG